MSDSASASTVASGATAAARLWDVTDATAERVLALAFAAALGVWLLVAAVLGTT